MVVISFVNNIFPKVGYYIKTFQTPLQQSFIPLKNYSSNLRGDEKLDPDGVQRVQQPQQVAGQLVCAAQRVAGLGARQHALEHALLRVHEALRAAPAPGLQADAARVLHWHLRDKHYKNTA